MRVGCYWHCGYEYIRNTQCFSHSEKDVARSGEYHFCSLCLCHSVPQYLPKGNENVGSQTKRLIFTTRGEPDVLEQTHG